MNNNEHYQKKIDSTIRSISLIKEKMLKATDEDSTRSKRRLDQLHFYELSLEHFKSKLK